MDVYEIPPYSKYVAVVGDPLLYNALADTGDGSCIGT